MKTLLIVYSYHHKNTLQIAEVIARVFGARIVKPSDIRPEELQAYDLVGFGSGIYSGRIHKSLLDFADRIPQVMEGNALIFSTSAMTGDKKRASDHSELREKVKSKGYVVVSEFQCKGFNTNSFMKYFGGMNKGRPNAEDLRHAEEFAESLKQELQGVRTGNSAS